MLSGEVDFILKCVAPDMATFQEFVTHLTAAPHVRNVRTSLVLHNSKYEAAVPLDVKVVELTLRVIPGRALARTQVRGLRTSNLECRIRCLASRRNDRLMTYFLRISSTL